MSGCHAAVGARRASLQRCLARRHRLGPGQQQHRAAAPAAAALAVQRRGFAGGPHFDGFPFGGGGFPGQAPPRGDSDKFYRLLGIEKDASEAAIKSAYKKQAMSHHPDKGGDEQTFKEISRAYEVLSDSQKRQLYDAYGEEGLNNMEQGGGAGGAGGPGMDPFDLFSQMFGFNAGGRGQRRGKPRTEDSRYDLQLTLEEIYAGTARTIGFTREALCSPCRGLGGHDRTTCSRCQGTGQQVTMQQMGLFVQQIQSPCGACGAKGYVIPKGKICTSCNGKGTSKEKKQFNVDIEQGVKEGTEFRFRGQADEAPGHDTGDVVIAVREKPHATFQRAKDSLIMSKKISLTEALCGFEFSTKYLDGKDLTIRSSKGQVVRPGDMMVIEGKGMPRPHGQRPGHLFLALEVDFPDRLDPATQRNLAEALGGKPLADTPPLGAETTRKLSKRQAQELKQQWQQAAHARQSGGQQGQQVQCAQQ